MHDRVDAICATRRGPGSTCDVLCKSAADVLTLRMKVASIHKSFVENKFVWAGRKRTR